VRSLIGENDICNKADDILLGILFIVASFTAASLVKALMRTRFLGALNAAKHLPQLVPCQSKVNISYMASGVSLIRPIVFKM
jgi:hypothetical protein